MSDALRARLRARLTLHENWREILFRAWSVRFALFAALCDGTVMLCGFFTDAPGGYRLVFAGLGMFATVGAGVARLMPQANVGSPTPQGDA